MGLTMLIETAENLAPEVKNTWHCTKGVKAVWELLLAQDFRHITDIQVWRSLQKGSKSVLIKITQNTDPNYFNV